MIYIDLDLVDDNPWQPRQAMDAAALEQLAEDIKSRRSARPDTLGLLQLPAGRIVDAAGHALGAGPEGYTWGEDISATLRAAGQRVQLAYGHRRTAAIRRLAEGWAKPAPNPYMRLPLSVVTFGDEEMATSAWAENSARRDLTPIEEAAAIAKMITDFGWSQKMAAEHLKLDETTVSNKLKLLKLPDEVQQALRAGDLSERQAGRLMPLLGLSDVQQAHLVKQVGTTAYYAPKQIFKEAATLTSDQIAQRVDSAIGMAFGALPPGFPTAQAFEEKGLHAPVCKDCPLYLSQGQKKRCGDKKCRERKLGIWQARKLAEASAQLGIPAADVALTWENHTDLRFKRQEIVDLVAALGCSFLRLAPCSGNSNACRPAGWPESVEPVCLHGKRKSCVCLVAIQQADPAVQERLARDQQAEEQRKAEGRQVEAEIYEPLTKEIAAALLGGNLVVWRKLLHRFDYYAHNELERTKKLDLDHILAAFARSVLRNTVHAAQIDDARKQALDFMKQTGLAIPGAANPAVDTYEYNMKRLERWLAEIDPTAITIDQVRGNLVNVTRMREELNQLPVDDATREAMSTRLGAIVDQLDGLIDICAQKSEAPIPEAERVAVAVR